MFHSLPGLAQACQHSGGGDLRLRDSCRLGLHCVQVWSAKKKVSITAKLLDAFQNSELHVYQTLNMQLVHVYGF